MKYLYTKDFVNEGGTIFSGISSYHDNGGTYYIDFDSKIFSYGKKDQKNEYKKRSLWI